MRVSLRVYARVSVPLRVMRGCDALAASVSSQCGQVWFWSQCGQVWFWLRAWVRRCAGVGVDTRCVNVGPEA